MSSLRDQIKQDFQDVFLNTDELAMAVTYNGTPINAVVTIGEDRAQRPTTEGRGSAKMGEMRVSVDDVPEPKANTDVVNIKGATWRVKKIISSNFAFHRLEITSDESGVGRPGR